MNTIKTIFYNLQQKKKTNSGEKIKIITLKCYTHKANNNIIMLHERLESRQILNHLRKDWNSNLLSIRTSVLSLSPYIHMYIYRHTHQGKLEF